MPKKPDLLARVRAVCLALPEATEKTAWGAPTFRVREKMFGSFADHHHGVDWVALWLHAPPGMQTMLVDSEPEVFFVPPYVGGRGWIGIRLDAGTNWDRVAELAEEAWRMVAPKKLLAELDDS